MARVSKEEALRTRALITSTSARLFRERGLNGISIADLMDASGLTHGGFYGHFASKEALAAEACDEAFAAAVARWTKRASAGGDAGRASIVDAYLSTNSRDGSGTGCPSAALAGDVAREPPESPVRAVFANGIEGQVGILASVEGTGDEQADRRQALADYATMVGALVLARATVGSPLSNEILQAARERLDRAAPARRTTRKG